MQEDIMQLKKDWADISARAHVSESGLDIDRAKTLFRYHAVIKLTMRQIADAVELHFAFINKLLRYGRFLGITLDDQGEVVLPTGLHSIRITERTFRAYWSGHAEARAVRQLQHKPDEMAAYEAEVFEAIRQDIANGVPPHKRPRKEKPIQPRDIHGVEDLARAFKQTYRTGLKRELDRLKSLAGCDRSSFTPNLLAGTAELIDREMRALFKLLDEACEAADSDHEPAAADADD